MIKDAQPLGCLPPNDPPEQLAPPIAEGRDMVPYSKFSHACDSQITDLWGIGIAPDCVVHPAACHRTLRPCIAGAEFR
jgi:hypothetical protein